MLKNAFFLFVGTIFVFAVFLPSYTELQDLKQTNRDYSLQIRQLKVEKKELLEEKRRLEEDPIYLEKVAREKMGLIKEGEVIYKILPANQEESRE